MAKTSTAVAEESATGSRTTLSSRIVAKAQSVDLRTPRVSETIKSHLDYLAKLAPEKRGEAMQGLVKRIKEIIGKADPSGVESLFEYIDSVRFPQPSPLEVSVANLEQAAKDTHGLSSGLKTAVTKVRSAMPAKVGVSDAIQQALFLLGALMALDVDAGLHLAVQFYIALLQGLKVEEILNALRLGQIYIGLPAYTAAVRTFAIVVAALSELPPETAPATVLDGLVDFYGITY